MLTGLWSPQFKNKGETRPAIEFHPELNIAEGADEAQISIDKSTLLQIMDSVYGRSDSSSNPPQ